jgi:hypothetical protein
MNVSYVHLILEKKINKIFTYWSWLKNGSLLVIITLLH